MIAVAVNGIVSVPDTPRIDAARETVLHEESDAPAEIIDDAGTMAVRVGSKWQTNSVSLRLIMPVAWALRSNNAVAWLTGVTW